MTSSPRGGLVVVVGRPPIAARPSVQKGLFARARGYVMASRSQGHGTDAGSVGRCDHQPRLGRRPMIGLGIFLLILAVLFPQLAVLWGSASSRSSSGSSSSSSDRWVTRSVAGATITDSFQARHVAAVAESTAASDAPARPQQRARSLECERRRAPRPAAAPRAGRRAHARGAPARAPRTGRRRAGAARRAAARGRRASRAARDERSRRLAVAAQHHGLAHRHDRALVELDAQRRSTSAPAATISGASSSTSRPPASTVDLERKQRPRRARAARASPRPARRSASRPRATTIRARS